MSSSDPDRTRTDADAWLHFAGVGGSGMSALAQFHARAGGLATGSDRAFDTGERAGIRRALLTQGVVLVPQDGDFAAAAAAADPRARGRRCDAVVVSTAVEDSVPDIRAARDAGLPLLHRSELLARYVAAHRTLAVSGTSGKSTVTALIYSLLRARGRQPGILTGGPLVELAELDGLGNAAAPGDDPQGGPPLLVIEADESDGSLVRYRPWLGLVLNLGLDHKEPAEVLEMFRTFRRRTQGPFLVGDGPALAEFREDAVVFGIAGPEGPAGAFAEDLETTPDGCAFTLGGVRFELPLPGRYNVLNAVAALAACEAAGERLADLVAPLAAFRGVTRRFQSVGSAGGVEVIDDFAHNPDKLAAALGAAADRVPAGRVLAVFQPHGFGPTRFLRHALVAAFAAALRPQDRLWLPEIYFAGGTVTRDISSADLAADVTAAGRTARFVAERADLPAELAAEARPGDLVLVMGARDPSLTDLCRDILAKLEAGPAA